MAKTKEVSPNIGPQVRHFREMKGWSQAELGVYAGVSPNTVLGIETGRRNASSRTLDGLARALDVEVQDLFPKDEALVTPDLVPDLVVDEGKYEEFQRLITSLEPGELLDAQRELRSDHRQAMDSGDAERAADLYARIVLIGRRLDELDPPLATVTIRRDLPAEVVFHREPTEAELTDLQDRYPDFVTVLRPEVARKETLT